MKSKSFFLLIILGTIMAGIAASVIVVNFDPQQVGFFQLVGFYSSLFLGLAGIIFLVLNLVKSKLFPRQLVVLRVSTAWRHAMLFSALLVGWAVLKSQNLAFWWVMGLFLAVLAMIEFFFMSLQKKYLSK